MNIGWVGPSFVSTSSLVWGTEAREPAREKVFTVYTSSGLKEAFLQGFSIWVWCFIMS